MTSSHRIDRRSFTVITLIMAFLVTAPFVHALSPIPPLTGLRVEHPRLMLPESRLAELKAMAATDPVLQGYVAQITGQADKLLDAKPLEHKLTGPRLLSVSRACLDRVYTLALAWRWHGDERYARAAAANLLTVCAFPDWNPKHFLDTAEMSHAVGVGYDWLYPWLDEATRGTIRAALINLGLKPGIAVYESRKGWPTSEHNWNQVCNGGMLAGALAIAETDPGYAETIVRHAVASLPRALASYGPDGAWMEGPAYWGYATRYTACGLCALDTALGHDFGLSDTAGLRNAGSFPDDTAGPTGLYLNYADSGERGRRKALPCLFWLASKYNDTRFSDAEHRAAAQHGAAPEHVVWYVPPTGKPAAERPLDKHFGGKVDVVVMRSAWDDPDALFVGVKGGYNQVNHGHLDLGNFEMDALGVRWVRDLGSDDYNLPGYWDRKPGGKRWKYYRLNSESHSVPLVNGSSQNAAAEARLLGFESTKRRASATLDLSSAYPAAKSATREVELIEKRRAVRVRDRFSFDIPADLTWGLTTDAEIELDAPGIAVLRLEGRELHARIVSPSGAAFSAASAERLAPEKPNTGVKRLLIRLPQVSGDVTVDVRLEPQWQEPAGQRRR